MITNAEFNARRQQLFASMPENSVAIIAANKEVTRSNDTEFPFCQEKNFQYLTGFPEPDAIVVLIKTNENKQVLFCREKDALQEVWHGRRIGPEVAAEKFGFDESFALSELETKLPEYFANKVELWHCHDEGTETESFVREALAKVRASVRQGICSPSVRVDCREQIHEMRLFKSEAEINIMREANLISGRAHQRAMKFCQPSKNEYHIEAELHHEFAMSGAKHPAYGSIVAGGDNANILHYTENSDELKDGDVLLIDAGCELHGYAADITRTFPINGKFTTEQAALYQLVLDAMNTTIEATKPGTTLAKLNDLCHQVLTKGLIELGILIGDYEELLAEKACKQYFIHGLGHWLGLDVHDVGDYQVVEKRQTRVFEPGMVLTIEPGLYIPSDDMSVDEKWRGLAIRIEDNIVITEQGHENLTTNSPKEIAEIEALMAS